MTDEAHFARHEPTEHCFLLARDSQGISPRNVPHFGQT